MWPLSETSRKVRPRSVWAVPSAPTPSTKKLSLAMGVWNPCFPFHVILAKNEVNNCPNDTGQLSLLNDNSRPKEKPLSTIIISILGQRTLGQYT